MAAARIKIRKRHGKQAQQQNADCQGNTPHQFRLVLGIAAANQLGGRNGTAV